MTLSRGSAPIYDGTINRAGVAMPKDHLNDEISVTGELTETGFKAGAKSRFLSAVDRLAGNGVDWINNRIEGPNVLARTKFESEAKILEAAAQSVADRMGVDPEFALRALQTQFRSAIREQENKDAVLQIAYESITTTSESADKADVHLSGEFLDRIESYAGRASTEDLRERWGRVLSAEVQAPGTFRGRVLRIVDEISAQTARDFETFCRDSIENLVPRALSGTIKYDVRMRLEEAELIVDPGAQGQVVNVQTISAGPVELLLWKLGRFSLAYPSGVKRPSIGGEDPILSRAHGIKVYVLTEAGAALKSIINVDELSNVRRLSGALKSYDWGQEPAIYDRNTLIS